MWPSRSKYEEEIGKMRFNTVALIIILTTSAISLLFSVAYGQVKIHQNPEDIRLTGLAIKSEVRASEPLIDRMRELSFKCGDYLTEKEKANMEPSVFVMKACLDVVEGYNSALIELFEEHKESVDKIELKKD
jgi:hypothetical protein